MKGFMLDENGDILIENGQIQLVNGDELVRQTVESVLGTNKGEWFLNIEEGINFSNLLGKGKEEDIIKDEILQGLSQVDSSFYLEDFKCEVTKRKLKVKFTAKNEQGETVKGAQEWH